MRELPSIVAPQIPPNEYVSGDVGCRSNDHFVYGHPSLADDFLIRVAARLCIQHLFGHAVFGPSMHTRSGSSMGAVGSSRFNFIHRQRSLPKVLRRSVESAARSRHRSGRIRCSTSGSKRARCSRSQFSNAESAPAQGRHLRRLFESPRNSQASTDCRVTPRPWHKTRDQMEPCPNCPTISAFGYLQGVW